MTNHMNAQASFSGFQWNNRLFVMYGHPADQTLTKQLQAFQTEQAGVQDRDMKIFVIDSKGKRTLGLDGKSLSDIPYLQAVEELGLGTKSFEWLLIGKDGGIKERGQQFVPPSHIFAIIDQMPMRRAEMRRNSKP